MNFTIANVKQAMYTGPMGTERVFVIEYEGKFFPFAWDTGDIEHLAAQWNNLDSVMYDEVPASTLQFEVQP